ncbi:MAG TPA: CHAT domain-containing protein [Thermoanaerobaculia bacterium]|nr:CHAT domain-containing protein [Thermoanaerobaculia bacterium]
MPSESALASDLAALYLTRARVQENPADLLESLDAADAALTREPRRREALFNRALTVQRLGLRGAAQLAWQRYLQVDPASGWAVRARAQQALAPPSERDAWIATRPALARAAAAGQRERVAELIGRFPQESRELAEGEAIAAWAECRRAGNSQGAVQALTVARMLGAAISALHGENMAADAVAAVERALASPANSDRLAALESGHLAYKEGMRAYAEGDIARAAAGFRLAGSRLAKGGSPFHLWAIFQGARCAAQRSDYAAVLAAVDPIASGSFASRYSALRGRCLALAGLIRIVRADPAGALSDLAQSLSLFTQLGEVANQAAAHTTMATGLDTLGDSEAAWKHFYLGLADARRSGASGPLYGAYGETIVAAIGLGHPEAARLFADEYVALARRAGDPAVRAGSLELRAASFLQLHRLAEAAGDLREGYSLLALLSDPAQRLSLGGDFKFLDGRIARQTDPRRAARALNEAAEIYLRRNNRFLLAAVLEERAQAWLALGDDRQAERDLATAISEREHQRSQIQDQERRMSFFEPDRSVFEEMIDFQVHRHHRKDLALDYAERGRARALLDVAFGSKAGSPSLGGSEPLRARELVARMPPGVTLIEYAAVKDRMLAWTVRRGAGLGLQELAASPSALERQVENLSQALRSGREREIATASSGLYELLVSPFASELPVNCRIVVVPDGPLHGLPFAALRDSRTGRFLIESHALSVAPSATLFLRALARDRALQSRGRARTGLIVADPAFDRGVFPELPRLPAAEAEAHAFERLALPTIVLRGTAATKNRFLSVARESTVVHFAGHALVNQRNPQLSELVLAPDAGVPEDRGVLYAHELSARRFERTRLVVLAACHSTRGRNLRSEGVVSLARSFLATGVPAVVASPIAVEDQIATEFFVRFYARLAVGEDTAAALQNAQIACLRSPEAALRRPESWAWFELIGAAGP